MVSRTLISVLIFSALLVANSCDVINPPYIDPSVGNQEGASPECIADASASEPFPAVGSIEPNALLEEFTGHQCGNCPEHTKVALRIKNEDFPGRVSYVAFHAGPLAEVEPPGSTKFTTDFTTDVGDQLYQEMKVIAVPTGLINRRESLLGSSRWATQVNEELNKAPEAGIRVFNCYDAKERRLSVIVDILYLVDGGNEEFLAVYLIEDNIVDWQKDYTAPVENIPDYIHHDVFRASLNGAYGLPLVEGEVKSGDRFTRDFGYTLPEAYDPSNCRIVAFVHDNSTGKVRQVTEAPLQ